MSDFYGVEYSLWAGKSLDEYQFESLRALLQRLSFESSKYEIIESRYSHPKSSQTVRLQEDTIEPSKKYRIHVLYLIFQSPCHVFKCRDGKHWHSQYNFSNGSTNLWSCRFLLYRSVLQVFESLDLNDS